MASTDGAEAPANAVSEEDTAQPPAEASPHSSNGDARPADCGVGAAEARRIQVTEEAQRIAELLSVSPETINIQVNVGFNTKFAAEEILTLRKDNNSLREQNRRLRARLGDLEPPDSSDAALGALGGAEKVLSVRELQAVLKETEAKLRELELENARIRMQAAPARPPRPPRRVRQTLPSAGAGRRLARVPAGRRSRAVARAQMAFVPEREHVAGHGAQPWV